MNFLSVIRTIEFFGFISKKVKDFFVCLWMTYVALTATNISIIIMKKDICQISQVWLISSLYSCTTSESVKLNIVNLQLLLFHLLSNSAWVKLTVCNVIIHTFVFVFIELIWFVIGTLIVVYYVVWLLCTCIQTTVGDHVKPVRWISCVQHTL